VAKLLPAWLSHSPLVAQSDHQGSYSSAYQCDALTAAVILSLSLIGDTASASAIEFQERE